MTENCIILVINFQKSPSVRGSPPQRLLTSDIDDLKLRALAKLGFSNH